MREKTKNHTIGQVTESAVRDEKPIPVPYLNLK